MPSPIFLASPFPNYIILFVLLGFLPLRGLGKFLTRPVLLEALSDLLFFCMALGCLLLFPRSNGMFRSFAAFNSCLQVLLSVLYQS